MAIKRISYLSGAEIPSPAANSINVMKMSAAFKKSGAKIVLYYSNSSKKNSDEYNIFNYYSINDFFRLRKIRKGGIINFRLKYILVILFSRHFWVSDLIYTRDPKLALFASLCGKQSIVELHRPCTSSDKRALKNYINLTTTPLVVVITHTLKNWLLENAPISSKNILVAPDGADLFDDSKEPIIPKKENSELSAGYMGHLYKGKGMELIEEIAPSMPQVRFDVVGGTATDLEFWKPRFIRMENVHFHGHVPHWKTQNYLKSFDLVLLPNQKQVATSMSPDSNISRWTSPLKAFEYMSAGLPIIASDQENLREVFKHKYNALLCDPENPREWVSAIEAVRGSLDLRSTLSRNARTEFEANYTWYARAQNILRRIEYLREE